MLENMAMSVAALETEVKELREDKKDNLFAIGLLTSERDQLVLDLADARRRADEELIRATTMETIMRSVSAGLIGGLKKMDDLTEEDRAAIRQRQEQRLGIGRDKPSFLQEEPEKAQIAPAEPKVEEPRAPEPPPSPRTQSLNPDIIPRFTGPRPIEQISASVAKAAEEIAPRRRGEVDPEVTHSLLPPVTMGWEEDDPNLKKVADGLGL